MIFICVGAFITQTASSIVMPRPIPGGLETALGDAPPSTKALGAALSTNIALVLFLPLKTSPKTLRNRENENMICPCKKLLVPDGASVARPAR
ncbi:MAG TPA: hypothetical protein VF801_01125 [Rhodocyclaceae bacterium]